jgi:hypothetical protein
MDDFAHVQTEMQASIDSQTNMMHEGGGVECPGMSVHLSHVVPTFTSYLVTCLSRITTIVMTASKYCFS